MRLIANFPLLLLLFISTSCEEFNTEPMVVQEEYDNWTVLQIPNGEEAHAISGSIDDVLVVTTYTKVYATKDAGETWDEVADFSGIMPGLLERNDSLFIFGAYGQGADYDIASSVARFSLDKGYTWQEDKKNVYSRLSVPIKYVKAENEISYKIKKNTFKLDGSETEYVGTSDIEKTIDDYTAKLEIPFEYILNNLHLDDQNRLYVAASYGTVNENGTVKPGGRNAPALVFISKSPLP
ncbi:hypothetical protein MATR_07180 [Marivirga tractuosa]|uniref:BNR repeat-containing glycosyl hydrolase n=1 Tax=Marivirga tractuosa (strain ATCC 23168 / DSM 4126 / NBRC 15989 / NCIMB 1408 / VKM B-1430 / H-43) TaxID=643867 RepID=E4TQV0_MARTH|nr:hypothetical protein [Marivirga tractuosa]ADR21650.1 hypothetical protein Ftrac_1662 [Marivirga tractuosa DSM 4126]BDD13893.1 hypothetical protein MATR_07180 [Marivirga tractuosa]